MQSVSWEDQLTWAKLAGWKPNAKREIPDWLTKCLLAIS